MAWGSETLGTTSPPWKWPKGPLSPFSFNRLGLGTIGRAAGGPLAAGFGLYDAGRIAEERPGLMSINPSAAPGLLFRHYADKLMGRDAESLRTKEMDKMIAKSDITDEEIAGVRGVGHFREGMDEEDRFKKLMQLSFMQSMTPEREKYRGTSKVSGLGRDTPFYQVPYYTSPFPGGTV